MNDPVISISGSQIAIFDCVDLKRDFEPFTNEAEAIEEAKRWIHARTDKEPRIVWPRITKLVMRS